MTEKSILVPKKRVVAKTPLIMQLERRDCGAACLSMVAAYYDKWVPLEQTRFDCGVSKNGVSAGAIVRAARSYGFVARGYSLEPDKLKEQGGYPCIIHWNMNHFVVLCGFSRGYAIINDPGKGRVKLPYADFCRDFTGVVIELSPSEDFSPSGHKKSMLSFARKRLAGLGTVVVLMMAVLVINSIFGYINPRMSRFYLDSILSPGDIKNLKSFIMIMALLAVGQTAVSLLQSVYRLKLEGRLAHEGNESFMRKLLSVPYEFFTQRMSGDLLARKEKNASISLSLVGLFGPLLIQAVMMVFFLVVMIRESLILTAIGLFTVALNLFLARFVANKRLDYSRMFLNDTRRLYSLTVMGIGMMESIYASGAEEGFFETWSGYQARKNSGRVSFSKIDAYLNMIPQFLSAASGYVVMMIAVYLTMEGRFTLGMMTAFLGYLSAFMNPAETLISSGKRLTEMRADMEQVEDVMEYPDDPLCDSGHSTGHSEMSSCHSERSEESFSTMPGPITAAGLTFGYARFEPPVLTDVSVSIPSGAFIAIVGHSGSGKTTLLRLLSGLYQPWSGSVLFDGKPIDAIGHRTFTKQVAVVDQDIYLFNDTIKNNLVMWNDDIRKEDMIRACRDAEIYDDIISRRDSFDAMLSDGGADLSGGQRERLEIARALCGNPSVIILDEATAALDSETERRVLDAIRRRGITCIMVTHRISAIRDCDEILVMDSGQIVERGRHEELFAQNGLYKTLVTNE